MTAETDLLPLPNVLTHWISLHAAHAADSADVREFIEHYARANVAHATAARDAEVEALRAEVARLTEYVQGWEQNFRAEKARAERLAEALREARVIANQARAAYSGDHSSGTFRAIVAKIDGALEQENDRG